MLCSAAQEKTDEAPATVNHLVNLIQDMSPELSSKGTSRIFSVYFQYYACVHHNKDTELMKSTPA